MTKIDIVDAISEKAGFTKKESADLMETVFDIIKGTLETGENIKVSGFGNFTVKQKANRIVRNPQTGETITIEARKIITYKPSTVLKQSLNKYQL